nr:uncharacterized protein LOC104607029 [Ipomoea trifida]
MTLTSNSVVDALSRRNEVVPSLMALSAPISPILESIRHALADSEAAQVLIRKIRNGLAGPHWSMDGELIRYKGKSMNGTIAIL